LNNLAHIVRQFSQQAIMDLQPLGNGLINDTFLVTTAASCFVLQRVNRQVFPEPDLITANIPMLNLHIRHKSNVRLTLPEILPTHAGEACYRDGKGGYWRCQEFIADAESLEQLNGHGDARQAGLALGHFHRLFSDLDPCFLHDTLPGFHVTPDYLSQYRDVLTTSALHDAYCAEFIELADFADELEQAKQQGLLPIRVVHGDPKLNNFLFDRQTRRVASLIDLDTVKPGLVHYDIGDCLRSCCHIEDTDSFDLEICAAILESYLAEAGHFFTDSDYDFLYAAIRLLPFELGLRFYTDYLNGNRYFKVSEPEQNLHRATRQFRLCASVMAQESDIKGLIEGLRPNHTGAPEAVVYADGKIKS